MLYYVRPVYIILILPIALNHAFSYYHRHHHHSTTTTTATTQSSSPLMNQRRQQRQILNLVKQQQHQQQSLSSYPPHPGRRRPTTTTLSMVSNKNNQPPSYPIRVAIMGGGNFGLAIAAVIARQNIPTTLLVRSESIARTLNTEHRHPVYMTDIPLPEIIQATS